MTADTADAGAPGGRVLLGGVVGSTAYGIATPHSDVDRLGVFAAPTEDFFGLTPPRESYVTTDPDVTLHEAGKFARLALKCNPTVSELLWLSEYDICDELGADLREIRSTFLSADAVRGAYLGYARQQLTKLINRGDGSFSADTRTRSAKHARHIARLVEQGEQLYTTGQLTVRLKDPQATVAMGEYLLADTRRGLLLLQSAEARMQCAGSPLPSRPDWAPVQAWLRAVRAAHYREPAGV